MGNFFPKITHETIKFCFLAKIAKSTIFKSPKNWKEQKKWILLYFQVEWLKMTFFFSVTEMFLVFGTGRWEFGGKVHLTILETHAVCFLRRITKVLQRSECWQWCGGGCYHGNAVPGLTMQHQCTVKIDISPSSSSSSSSFVPSCSRCNESMFYLLQWISLVQPNRERERD